jgi:hypothetical protein
MGSREERLAGNEALFREVNKRVAEVVEAFIEVEETADPVRFNCECGSGTCTEQIEMTLVEYEASGLPRFASPCFPGTNCRRSSGWSSGTRPTSSSRSRTKTPSRSRARRIRERKAAEEGRAASRTRKQTEPGSRRRHTAEGGEQVRRQRFGLRLLSLRSTGRGTDSRRCDLGRTGQPKCGRDTEVCPRASSPRARVLPLPQLPAARNTSPLRLSVKREGGAGGEPVP